MPIISKLGGISVTNQDKRKILLLLSGGKDSHQVLKLLLEEGHAVHCLCIDGIQGLERVGAARAAQELGASLDVVKLSFFDEETWNPAKLLLRDLAMGYIAIKKAKSLGATQLATGVKKADLADPDLWWLPYFLNFGKWALGLLGIELLFPIWNAAASDKTAEKSTVKKSTTLSKRVFYKSLQVLPEKLRHPFYRMKYAKVPIEIPPGLTFQLARSKEELEAAFKLLHNAYVEQGFIKPQESGMRFIIQHALPTTSILIAKMNEVVVGTISVMRDTPLGLPMEKAFDISHLKVKGQRVAEFSSLAIHPDFRRSMSGVIFFPLTLYAANFAKNCFGTDFLVFNLYPHHADFYNAIFGSSYLKSQKAIADDYLGTPAAGIQLDLKEVVEFAREKYDGLPAERNLYDYTFFKKHSYCIYPASDFGSINHPVMTPDIFRYFFIEKSKILEDISLLEGQVLNSYYPLDAFSNVIPMFKKKSQEDLRVDCRWDVKLLGEQVDYKKNERNVVSFTDVSRWGFKANAEREFKIQNLYTFEIKLSDQKIAVIIATPVWSSRGEYGFKIIEENEHWHEIIILQERKLIAIAA